MLGGSVVHQSPSFDVMNEQITRAGLTRSRLIRARIKPRILRGVAGEARCWGHLELEEGAREEVRTTLYERPTR